MISQIHDFLQNLIQTMNRRYWIKLLFGAVIGRKFQESNKEKACKICGTFGHTMDKSNKRFRTDLFEVARGTNQNFNTVAKAATEFSRQDWRIENIVQRIYYQVS